MIALIEILVFIALFRMFRLYGIGRLHKEIGAIATLFLVLSIPLYALLIGAAFRDLESNVFMSPSTIKVLALLLLCHMLTFIFFKIHDKK